MKIHGAKTARGILAVLSGALLMFAHAQPAGDAGDDGNAAKPAPSPVPEETPKAAIERATTLIQTQKRNEAARYLYAQVNRYGSESYYCEFGMIQDCVRFINHGLIQFVRQFIQFRLAADVRGIGRRPSRGGGRQPAVAALIGPLGD